MVLTTESGGKCSVCGASLSEGIELQRGVCNACFKGEKSGGRSVEK